MEFLKGPTFGVDTLFILIALIVPSITPYTIYL
jgi:hypothetical protein